MSDTLDEMNKDGSDIIKEAVSMLRYGCSLRVDCSGCPLSDDDSSCVLENDTLGGVPYSWDMSKVIIYEEE